MVAGTPQGNSGRYASSTDIIETHDDAHIGMRRPVRSEHSLLYLSIHYQAGRI